MKKQSVKLLIIYTAETKNTSSTQPQTFSIQNFTDQVIPNKTQSMRKDSFLTIILCKKNQNKWSSLTTNSETGHETYKLSKVITNFF